MTDWNGSLTGDQTGHPVVWHSTLDDLGYGDMVAYPELDAAWFHAFWGDTRDTNRLRVFGHQDKSDKAKPHFLCTRRAPLRGAVKYHTDPGYARYCLQIQLCNPGGFMVHGPADIIDDVPLYNPGLVILLDSWSPHAVSRDPRMPHTGINKLLAGIDFRDKPDIARELPKLIEHIPLLRLP